MKYKINFTLTFQTITDESSYDGETDLEAIQDIEFDNAEDILVNALREGEGKVKVEVEEVK